MIYKVISPIVATIDGDSLKEAVKNFIKINHNLNINNMIIKDQSTNYEAKIKYYQQDGRNKVGINMFPINSNYLPIANDTFIPNNIIEPNMSIFPLSPLSPLSPNGISSFIPSVVNIPLNL
jgi:hypothetical protein